MYVLLKQYCKVLFHFSPRNLRKDRTLTVWKLPKSCFEGRWWWLPWCYRDPSAGVLVACLKKASSDLQLYSQQIKIKPSGVCGASVICAFSGGGEGEENGSWLLSSLLCTESGECVCSPSFLQKIYCNCAHSRTEILLGTAVVHILVVQQVQVWMLSMHLPMCELKTF